MPLITVNDFLKVSYENFLFLIGFVIISSGCTNKKSINREELVSVECDLSNQLSKQCEILNSKNLAASEKEVTLGLLYLFGNNVVAKNYEKAFYLLSRHTQDNNTEALNGLGIMYLYGLGVNEDLEVVKVYFEKANILGDKVAKINLGELYRKK